jgi:rhodanese-related sulfurtransferase
MTPYTDIEATHLAEMIAGNQQFTLVDVRNDDEVARGIIQSAVHIPLMLLANEFTQLDPEKTIVFYCHSGIRSAQAVSFLANHGFDDLYNLRGGVLAWGREGYPFVAKT